MKKTTLFILLAFVLVAMVTAQGWGRGGMQPRMQQWNRSPGGNQWQMPPAETVTVSGSLAVSNGMPAIESGDTTYLVGGIMRLTGFIDGLKEGAQVTIEGRAVSRSQDSKIKFLMPSKLTLGGKTYDLSLSLGNFGPALRQWGNDQRRQPQQPAPQPRSPRQPAPTRRQRFL